VLKLSRIDIIGQNGNDGHHYCPSCKHNEALDMDIDLYQKFTPTTAVYPMAGTHGVEEALYLSSGLASEAGEVAGLIKKWWRDGQISRKDVQKELGDVMWYISQLANTFDLDLTEVLIINRDKLIDRANRDKIRGKGDER
jgi:NTP pyrophosphatase (non-canonical NTP hydrolase)